MSILVTEWKPFRQPNRAMMRLLMKGMGIFDGRNQYNPDQMKAAGFEYFGIGRGDGVLYREDAQPACASRVVTVR